MNTTHAEHAEERSSAATNPATAASLPPTESYQGMGAQEAFARLGSGPEGLAPREAARRLAAFGRNAVEKERPNRLLAFLKRYWGPMPWLLEIAMVLTFAIGHATEGIIIFVLLTVNAVVGFMQARNSGRAVDLLQSKLEVRTHVRRGGAFTEVDARDVVPGDIVELKLGDLVPADTLVLSGTLSVDASALTGESLPQSAGPGSVVYSSAIVKHGEGTCLVVNTGARTYFGTTVSLVQIARPASRQQKLLFDIVTYMMVLGTVASVAVALFALVTGSGFTVIATIVITFLMGAIPVALPAVLTIVQAVSALELSDHGVLVTRLDSIEDASAIDVFCFDKTGTITQNRLAVTSCAAANGYSPADVAALAALASSHEAANAIDNAVIAYAGDKCGDFASGAVPASSTGDKGGSQGDARLSARFSPAVQTAYTPFDPARRCTRAEARCGSAALHVVKGAPDTVVAEAAGTDSKTRVAALRTVEKNSQRGYRSLAVAMAQDGGPLMLAGVLALSDPPRPDSAEMIGRLRGLGVRSLMLTGDNLSIAQQVAREVGVGGNIRPASELRALTEEDQRALIRGCDGFAEVYPEDKYRIVELLQKDGHLVGMTGDGVNDAPALKQAELGCAVADATDVARASASAVLTQPGLSGVIEAVTASRRTYQRMLTWVLNKVAKVVETVVLFSAGFFLTHNLLISLAGMSLLVFANDFATMSIATDNVTSTASPNSWRLPNLVAASAVVGTCFALFDLGVAYVGAQVLGLSAAGVQTLVLLALVFNAQIRVLIVRERRHAWSSRPGKLIVLVSVVVVACFALAGGLGLMMDPVPWPAIGALLLAALASGAVIDLVKYAAFRLFRVA